MAYFVKATENILKHDGIQGASIRRIAAEAGYNSATLYNYFPDLEYLILYGSVGYLRDYILLLKDSLDNHMTSLERYKTVYTCFNHFAFQDPEIFYNMFFGRYSGRMTEVVRTYYQDLFPEQLEGLPEDVQQMVIRGTLVDRDRIIMSHMVQDGFVAPEKEEMTLELIIALHESYIHKACLAGPKLDKEALQQRFMTLFDYILAHSGPDQ